MLRLDSQSSRLRLHAISSTPLSSNTLPPPPTSLLYLSSLYSLCRLYDFHAALRDSQKKRKDALQGSSALLGLIAMPRLRGRSDQPPLYLFLLPLYIPYIILTPTRGKLFEQQKVGDVFFGGGAFALCFSISLFLSKEKKGKACILCALHSCFHCLQFRLLTRLFFFDLFQHMLSTNM